MIDQERRLKDQAFISDPDKWPNWPVLPLKRPIGYEFNCGALIGGRGLRVFEVNIWNLPKTQKEWDAVKDITYTTIDELLDAGWIVD